VRAHHHGRQAGDNRAMPLDSSAPTPKDLAAARADLDRWAHYSDHPGFIQKAGGQDSFDAEHERRLRHVAELDDLLPAAPPHTRARRSP
jgi:hypothetical protein